MTALPVNLLQIFRFSVDLVHGPAQAVFMLLVLRVLGVWVVARADEAVFVWVGLARHNWIFLVDAVDAVNAVAVWLFRCLCRVLGDLGWLLLQSVGTRVLNEARPCNHILHALLLYLLKIPLVLQHPTQVLNLAYVANSCLLELQVVLVLQVLSSFYWHIS